MQATRQIDGLEVESHRVVFSPSHQKTVIARMASGLEQESVNPQGTSQRQTDNSSSTSQTTGRPPSTQPQPVRHPTPLYTTVPRPQPSTSTQPSPQTQLPAQTQAASAAAQSYYTMGYPPGSWQNAWQLPRFPYATSGSAPYQQTHYAQIPYAQYQSYQAQAGIPLHSIQAAKQQQRVRVPPKPRTPTPEPVYRHWDEVLRAFLRKVGLTQTLRGFEDDLVVMNEDWEKKCVPGAIGDLVRDMTVSLLGCCRCAHTFISCHAGFGKV